MISKKKALYIFYLRDTYGHDILSMNKRFSKLGRNFSCYDFFANYRHLFINSEITDYIIFTFN